MKTHKDIKLVTTDRRRSHLVSIEIKEKNNKQTSVFTSDNSGYQGKAKNN